MFFSQVTPILYIRLRSVSTHLDSLLSQFKATVSGEMMRTKLGIEPRRFFLCPTSFNPELKPLYDPVYHTSTVNVFKLTLCSECETRYAVLRQSVFFNPQTPLLWQLNNGCIAKQRTGASAAITQVHQEPDFSRDSLLFLSQHQQSLMSECRLLMDLYKQAVNKFKVAWKELLLCRNAWQQ